MNRTVALSTGQSPLFHPKSQTALSQPELKRTAPRRYTKIKINKYNGLEEAAANLN